jgi:hypothetical protein
LLLELLHDRDEAKREWLKSWVNSEVGDLMSRDRNDMRNHLEMHAADLDKLRRLIEKFKDLQGKQAEMFKSE